MYFILIVYGVFEKPIRAWKQTTKGYDAVVVAVSLLSFCILVAFLFLHSIAVISNVISLHCHVFSFTEMGKGYGRGTRVAIATRAERCILGYSVQDR